MKDRPLGFETLTYGARDPEALAAFYREALGVDHFLQFEAAITEGNPRQAGLFHTAFLYPNRSALAVGLLRLHALGVPVEGASDHDVSEAIYLSDPEGNGIEIYADRPRHQWRYVEGNLVMRTLPLDMEDLLGSVPPELQQAADESHRLAGVSEGHAGDWRSDLPGTLPTELRVPAGITIGHVHLRALDLTQAEQFWAESVGMDVTARYEGVASFLSAAGYHHHVGVNRFGPWAERHPESSGLRRIKISVSQDSDLNLGSFTTPEGIEVKVEHERERK